MKTLHTPGNWQVEESYETLWIFGNGKEKIVCHTSNETELKENIKKENRSNFNLIAAAPEMFHLLNCVLPCLKAVGTNGNHWAELVESCLAKATGEKEQVG